MRIFTRRNALLGWVVYRVARRKAKHRLGLVGGGQPRRRGILAGLGLSAVALTALALWTRRGQDETSPAGG
jgi:hypothetical protein